MPDTIKLRAPNGLPIKGTLEQALGHFPLSALSRDDAGFIDFEYLDGAEVSMGDPETVTREGEIVFVDTEGNEWEGSQLVPISEEVEAA